MIEDKNKTQFKFTKVPKRLMHILDPNLRTMLFALIDISEYMGDKEGWFFRTNSDLVNDSKLSENLARATVDTLFKYSIIEVSCVGKGKRKKPNKYRLNNEVIALFDALDMSRDINKPNNQISTVEYKGSGYHPSYLDETPKRYKPKVDDGNVTWIELSPTKDSPEEHTREVTKSENNINNINSKQI